MSILWNIWHYLSMTETLTCSTKKIKISWSPQFAYAVGLITTDGNLSSATKCISLCSSDLEQVENFKRALNLNNRITPHESGTTKIKGFRIQFGQIALYEFLNQIGITAKKSLTIGEVRVPRKFYEHFLRGHFDGDGTFYSYWDKRWRSSYMMYLYFYSASKKHLEWIQENNKKHFGISGRISRPRNDSTYSLRYAKFETIILAKRIYKRGGMRLSRKYLKIKRALAILGKSI